MPNLLDSSAPCVGIGGLKVGIVMAIGLQMKQRRLGSPEQPRYVQSVNTLGNCMTPHHFVMDDHRRHCPFIKSPKAVVDVGRVRSGGNHKRR